MSDSVDDLLAEAAPVMTPSDVAAVLGRSYGEVRRWLAAGDMPGYQLPARRWIIIRSELAEWLRDRKNMPEED